MFGPARPRSGPHHRDGLGSVLRTLLRGHYSMIKSELVRNIAQQQSHLYERDVDRVVTGLLDEIVAALARGDRVELRGFGVFSAKTRAARIARNPRTGLLVSVGARRLPVFKTGKDMRVRLNRSTT